MPGQAWNKRRHFSDQVDTEVHHAWGRLLLEFPVCEGVEKEGVKQEGGTCVYSQPVFYEGLAQTQLAYVDHDVVEMVLATPL